MNDLGKANELLVKELQELQKEHYALKAMYEKDIKESRQSEEKLRVSEEKFRGFFELTGDLVCIASIDGYFQQLNGSWETVLGFTRQELMQKSYLDFVHPEDRDKTIRIIQEKLAHGELVLSFENRYMCKNGGFVWLEWTSQPIPEKGVTFAIARNITERKRIEETLRDNEHLLRESQEVARLGSFVWDIGGGLWTSSNILDDIFGINETYIRSMEGWAAIVHPDWREIMINYVVSEVLGKHQRFDKEYKIINQRNGEVIWVHGLADLKLDENSQPSKLIGTITNISLRKQFEESLLQTQLFLNSIIDHSPNAMWISDEYGTLIRLNQACREKLHLKDEEVLGNYNIFKDNIIEEQGFMPMVKDVFTKGLTAHFTFQYETSSLNNLKLEQTLKVFLDVHISPIFDSQGKVIHAVIQQNDITELKQAEEMIKKSEVQLANALDIAKLGSWEYDVASDTFTFNDHFYNIFRTTAEREGGYTMTSSQYAQRFVHPDDAPQVGNETRKAIETTDPNFSRNAEHRIIYADGEMGYINVHFFIVKDEQGHTVKTYGVNQDITESKLVKEKLREKDIQFRKLSSNLPDLIYQFTRRTDGSYCVPIASEGIKNIFGCSPEDVVDDFTPIARVIFPEDSERVISDIEYSAKHLTHFSCEFRVQIPDKPIQWIFSRSTPEKLADGSVTWYGFNANITEIKQTELELIKAKEKAEESDRLKSAFLANMSHEIRTPMNGIMGFAELLKEPHLTDEEQQKYISVIQRSGKRMLNIINDIVDISKIESGQMEIAFSEVNVNEIMEFIYSFFKSEVEKKGLQLTVKTSIPSKEVIIKSDREKIYAILTNLVNNAIKFTITGTIEFGYEKKGNFIEFYVKDTGSGVSEHQREIIFERFRQGNDLITQFTEGTGLGLSISKNYVEMLGGKIWVESEVGKGSVFYFTIPFDADTNKEVTRKAALSFKRENYQGKDLKILVAEDDQVSEMFITTVIEIYCKELLKATTGIEAVETCRTNPDMDLILMDVRMTELDGYSATRQIREFNKDVIIIAQTGFAMAGEREKAIKAGCNDYISKPIKKEELKGLIQKYFSA